MVPHLGIPMYSSCGSCIFKSLNHQNRIWKEEKIPGFFYINLDKIIFPAISISEDNYLPGDLLRPDIIKIKGSSREFVGKSA